MSEDKQCLQRDITEAHPTLSAPPTPTPPPPPPPPPTTHQPGCLSCVLHRWMSVAMALAEATHHPAPRSQGRGGGGARDVRPLRARSSPPPAGAAGTCLRSQGRRRQSRSVTWLPGLPLAVVPVSVDRIDDAALQFLLLQSHLARAEEEKAREEAVVNELEEELVVRERRLLRLVGELRGAGSLAHAELSRLGLAVVRWYMAKTKVVKRKKKKKKKKKKKRRKPGSLFTCSSS